ncbi:MAG: FHA domain-containing protein [Calditrichaeota bacterium]|nr:MAG: FHA domain-containing protein [Calditrichota bacterium]
MRVSMSQIRNRKVEQAGSPSLTVQIIAGNTGGQPRRFTREFTVGRDPACEVVVDHPLVSRIHLKIEYEHGRWWVVDTESTNGTYVGTTRMDRVAVDGELELHLGRNGPRLRLTAQETSAAEQDTIPEGVPSETYYRERYFGEGDIEGMSERTRIIRRAFSEIRQKQKQWGWIAGGCGLLLLLLTLGYMYYYQSQIERLTFLAKDTFYRLKSLELELAALDVENLSPEAQARRARLQLAYGELEQTYNRFMETLGIYEQNLSEEDRLIFRVARIFGECELTMPPDFVQEVKHYIRRWQSTDRLEKAIRRALRHNYHTRTTRIMLKHHLPPQYFYLALQESDFKPRAGPKTRVGIAKGHWQFIPRTAAKYGLRIGPLVELRRYDPRDERYDFDKACDAAARYIKDLYQTEAQASGLLVIACYNWGEERILPLLQQMPADPRERNFWQLLQKYKIPRETYDYVMYIVSAAVIGENPRLFGFDFDNPLATALAQAGESLPSPSGK